MEADMVPDSHEILLLPLIMSSGLMTTVIILFRTSLALKVVSGRRHLKHIVVSLSNDI